MLLTYIIAIAFILSSNADKDIIEARQELSKNTEKLLQEVRKIINTQYSNKKLKLTKKTTKVQNINEREINKDISKNIKTLENYIKIYPNSPELADILYQLAVLYYEEDSTKYLKESEHFESLVESGVVNIAPPSPNYSRSIKTFKKLLIKYPHYSGKESVYYFLSQIYSETDEPSISVYYLKKILKEYPNSPKIPEITFRIAEYYFDIDQNTKAARYYSLVLNFSNSEYYENALYKLAWTYYRKRKVRESVRAFINYIYYKSMTDPQSLLINEALDKIAKSFADVEWSPKKAHKLLKDMGQLKYEFSILKELCSIYAKASLIRSLKKCTKETTGLYPTHPELPDLYETMLKTLESNIYSVKRGTKAPMNIAILVNLFGTQSKWRKENISNKSAIQKADELMEKYLLKTALLYQKLGDKTKLIKYYKRARSLYEEFINTHKTSSFINSARLNYAKILFLLGNYQKAFQEYVSLANYLLPISLEDSAITYYEGIVAHNSLLLQKDKKYKTKIKIPKQTKKLSELEKEHISLCERFLNKYPKIEAQLKCKVMYEKAEIYIRTSHITDAIKIYDNIITSCPNTEIQVDAIKNLTAIYVWKNDFKKVQELSAKLIKYKKFLKKKEQLHYSKLLSGAIFKEAKQLEEAGETNKAIKEYLNIATKHPRSKFASVALFNASILYLDNNNIKQGKLIANKLFNKYKKSELTPSLAFKIALIEEKHLNIGEAIKYYKISLIGKETRRASIYSLYLLYRALGNFNKALYYYTKYNKKDKITPLEMAKQLNNMKYFRLLYKKMRKPSIASNIKIKYYLYFYQLTQNKNYLNKAMKLALLKPKKLWADSKYLIAKLYYNSIKTSLRKYKAISLDTTSPKKTKILFKLKQKLLDRLTGRLNTILKLEEPLYTIITLFTTANILQNFYVFIKSSPIPNNLNDEEKKMYTQQLEQLASPYKEQASTLYKNIIKVETETGKTTIYSTMSKKAIEQIEKAQNYNPTNKTYRLWSFYE